MDFKISIVTPNFNGGKYLEKTIHSVLSQNYPNLEYIIIDGGSTDNSVEIIKKYEEQLAYWISEPDSGLYEAVQKGFERSTGEIMAWINSDDMYHPNAFLTVAEIFKLTQVNWLQGLPSFFDEKGRIVAVNSLKRWSKLDYYLGDFKWIQQESVFWRRTLWDEAGGKIDTSMKYAGDFELWLKFFRYESLYVTTALLGGFRQRAVGQLPHEFHDLYLREVRSKIEEEVNNKISEKERNLVNRIKKYNLVVNKIPSVFFRKIAKEMMKSLLFKVKNYPAIIVFDRIQQEFKIDK